MASKIMAKPWLGKRTNNVAMDTYVGIADEPIIDYRTQPPRMLVTDGIRQGGDIIEAGEVSGIAKPELLYPANNETSIPIDATIRLKPFVGFKRNGAYMLLKATYWLVSLNSNMSSPIFNSGRDTLNLDSINLAFSNIVLPVSTDVYVQVKYESVDGFISEYGDIHTFKTTDAVPRKNTSSVEVGDGIISGFESWQVVETSALGNVIAYSDTKYNLNRGRVVVYDGGDELNIRQVIEPPEDLPPNARFGRAIAVAPGGFYIAITASGTNEVFVYRTTDIGPEFPFIYKGKITKPAGAGVGFGYDVAVSSSLEVIVVGDRWATVNSESQAGNAYVYEMDTPGSYTYVNTPPAIISAGVNASANGWFSADMRVTNDTIVVGAPRGFNVAATTAGRIYTFKTNGVGLWPLHSTTTQPSGDPNQFWGGLLHMNTAATFLVVGGTGSFTVPNVSIFSIFEFITNAWVLRDEIVISHNVSAYRGGASPRISDDGMRVIVTRSGIYEPTTGKNINTYSYIWDGSNYILQSIVSTDAKFNLRYARGVPAYGNASRAVMLTIGIEEDTKGLSGTTGAVNTSSKMRLHNLT